MNKQYPRDLIGYGGNPPQAAWPGQARLALQFVLNYEEGGENCVLHGDCASEQFLSKDQQNRESLIRLVMEGHLRGIVGQLTVEQIVKVANQTGAKTVHGLHHYEPWWRAAEEELAGRLDLCLHDGNYLLPPGTVVTGSGQPYKIYTPFAKAAIQQLPQRNPLDAPAFDEPEHWPASDELDDWKLLPTKPDWAKGFGGWTPGENGAHVMVNVFKDSLRFYNDRRDLPASRGTSRLSPHLHHGEISPRQVWHTLAGRGEGAASFHRELGWRDFTSGLIVAMPNYADTNGRARFDRLKWRHDPEGLRGLLEDQTLRADLIVTSGGTGIGPGDMVRRILSRGAVEFTENRDLDPWSRRDDEGRGNAARAERMLQESPVVGAHRPVGVSASG